MNVTQLLSLSPLDGRYANQLEALNPLVSEYGLIQFRLQVEVEWLITLSQTVKPTGLDKFSDKSIHYLTQLVNNFSLAEADKIKQIEATTKHDVKAVEYYLQQKLSINDELNHAIPFIHFGCTSEDINNVAYALMVKRTRDEVLIPKLEAIINFLKPMTHNYRALAMLARTHGQAASPTTVGKEFANVIMRLSHQLNQLKKLAIPAKFNGAVGNYNAHVSAFPNIDWLAVTKRFIENLGLDVNTYTTQIEPHDHLAALLHNISRINTILLDFSRDVWSYISLHYFGQKHGANEIGSSTMPHKINPIDFENAEGNLGIANALAQHLANKLPISRWQRDLSDSTVLRNLGSVFGYCLLAYQNLLKGLNKIEVNVKIIGDDLNNHWEVLAEAVQTVMRAEGIIDAYEQLKAFTRGKNVSQATLQQFIQQSQLSDSAKQRLLALTPQSYVGLAANLADTINLDD